MPPRLVLDELNLDLPPSGFLLGLLAVVVVVVVPAALYSFMVIDELVVVKEGSWQLRLLRLR